MLNALALYRRYVAASIRAQMAYPAALGMMSLGQFLATVIEFVGVADLLPGDLDVLLRAPALNLDRRPILLVQLTEM